MRTRKNEYSENSENIEYSENIEPNKVQEISNNKIKLFLYKVSDQLYIFLKVSFCMFNNVFLTDLG